MTAVMDKPASAGIRCEAVPACDRLATHVVIAFGGGFSDLCEEHAKAAEEMGWKVEKR